MPDAGISNRFPEIATPVYALVRNDSGGCRDCHTNLRAGSQ